MSSSEPSLETIKAKREVRDRLMLQDLMPVLNELRRIVNTWIDGEFKDLKDEISHVDSFAPSDSASERISRFMTELTQIRNDQMPKALKELDKLIKCIQQQKFESVEEAINMLKKKVPPIISVIFNLVNARERLDDMADMIPILELPPLPSHRENEEGN